MKSSHYKDPPKVLVGGAQCELVGNLTNGVYAKMHDMSRRVYDPHGLSPTIHTIGGGNLEPKIIDESCAVRKLTPLECWRLMGFSDEDFHKAKNALNAKFYNGRDRSSSQLYKMAGNSIVVNVLMAIKKRWFT